MEASGAEGGLATAKEGLRRLSRLLYLYSSVKEGTGDLLQLPSRWVLQSPYDVLMSSHTEV